MTLLGSHVLSLILFTPLAGALLLLVIPRRHEAAIRWIANLFGVTGLVASLPLWFRYQPQGAPWQFVERAEWIPSIGASYFLGVDGLSALLVLLTTLIGAIAILSSWSSIADRIKEYYVCLLVLQTAMIGAFVSLDALLFFFFWEVMLVPMYFLIGIWGGGRRLYSAIKFFLYTLTGGVVMLLGILAVYFYAHSVTGVYTFDIPRFHELTIPAGAADLDLPGLLLRVCREGPDVPAPHVAAGRTHRRTNRRVRHPCRGDAQDGRLRVPAFQSSGVARGIAPVRAGHGRACDCRHHLRRARRAGAERLEASGRVFEREPHGHGDSRHVHAHTAGHLRQHRPPAQSRDLHRRPVPARRHDLRTAPHPRDIGLRRPLRGDAGVRDDLLRDDDVVDRTARRSTASSASSWSCRAPLSSARPGRPWPARRCPRRRLHAVAVSADDVREGGQSVERVTARL